MAQEGRKGLSVDLLHEMGTLKCAACDQEFRCGLGGRAVHELVHAYKCESLPCSVAIWTSRSKRPDHRVSFPSFSDWFEAHYSAVSTLTDGARIFKLQLELDAAVCKRLGLER